MKFSIAHIPPSTLSVSQKIALFAAATFVVLSALYGIGRAIGIGNNQTTDDAYIAADYTVVAPKVAGFIAEVRVQENQKVHVGDLLVRIDDHDYRAALSAANAGIAVAQAGLSDVEASLARQQTLIAQAAATVAIGRTDVTFARYDFERYTRLAKLGAGTVQNAQQARAKIDTAQAHLAFDEASLAAAREQVYVLQAQHKKAAGELARAEALREQARLNLSYTQIVAPIDGIAGQRAVRLGGYVNPGMPLLAVVPIRQAYVVANFRETQLVGVRPSQHVRIAVDSLPGVTLNGTVDSIAPATGTTFSPLKPSNATGNFTKIVQRIPVKIVFDAGQPVAETLRAGMSVVATIDMDSSTRESVVLNVQAGHAPSVDSGASNIKVVRK
jgi:membrane fusion protein (multidrug efflux system)